MRKLAVTTILLALFVAFVAIRIEYLNCKVGGILPRSDYRYDNPEAGLPKWRSRLDVTEENWRMMHLREEEEGRTLSDAERREMMDDIERSKANNVLRDFVGSFGLLQYPLVLLLVVLSISLLWAKERNLKFLACPCLAVAFYAGSVAIYRGYFTSLGW
ncbi:MAG: hypothetical protein L6R28_24630 [Planctomycetes bacterium]|nr:hypothetical protein [Planctomycetota bacterium]